MSANTTEEQVTDELLDRAQDVLIRAAEVARDVPKTKEEIIEEALNCPCIAKMKEGSCGDVFVTAYRCFLESETEPRGMDCMDKFQAMHSCMVEHPDEYDLKEGAFPDEEESAQKAPESAGGQVNQESASSGSAPQKE